MRRNCMAWDQGCHDATRVCFDGLTECAAIDNTQSFANKEFYHHVSTLHLCIHSKLAINCNQQAENQWDSVMYTASTIDTYISAMLTMVVVDVGVRVCDRGEIS